MMQDDVGIVSVLSHSDLDALVRMIPVDYSVAVQHPHLRPVPMNVLSDHDPVAHSFSAKNKIHDH